ncbi:hypothetical protein QYE76_069070 [Lolium multiflorum]|uniref:Uncharacterized protein n=1 Tax=Lolium multiflorum TaxID=4521 RepID=A0AAD8SFK9_LOLMU|nr:hypothetical protein QYE76_069070 [Lolium multiflorum]
MENYSLLMGAAVMKMAVEMAAVSMEKPSGGTSPLGRVRNETPVPDLGFAMTAAGRFLVSWLPPWGFDRGLYIGEEAAREADRGPHHRGAAPYSRAKVSYRATVAPSVLPEDLTKSYSRLCGAENTREKRALRRAGIRRGNSLPEGEIDAIAIVIERDIISTIIIIISTIYTAITIAAPRHRCNNSAAEETRASPMKRSIGGFADEDDLLDFDDAFIEPPPKRVRSDAVSPAAAASEASALKAAPVAQASTASSLSKGKDAPAAAAAPPSRPSPLNSPLWRRTKFGCRRRLSLPLQSWKRHKKAAVARQEVDSLKEELNKLKERLKEEEARAAEKDELLRQSALALLEAADIPATALDKIPSNSPANGVSTVLTAHQLTRGLLDKGKGALARMHSMIFPKATQEKTLGQLIDAFAVDTKEVIEVFPVPSFVDDSSGVLPESDRIQRMKDRITQMEKDLRSTYALAAIINKKSETAADVERYALTELHKATESLNFIALNRAEESKRIHERVNALIELSSAEEIFWREHSKASTVAQFQDRVQQVHHFFDKCYKAMRVVWKTMFPLNAVPPTLLALMSEFGNAKKIRDLVRAQVFAGARFTLALVLARYPSAGLLSIANVTGDLEALYPKVLLPANIIVDRLEKDSKVPEEKGTPQG